ncbi:SRR1-like protein [Geodia barretti]|uniref:SRR1-like protein n=1 Tax=Geodia barretti TaxID=519541 RepID=A0AA35WJ17_GEOBA|nr:SRR1-like protein [Geodia barretti]
MANDDGFQIVSRGVRPRQHVRSGRKVCCDSGSVEIVSSVLRTREDLNMMQYAAQIEGLLEGVECEDLICYGIGLFGTCRIARLQLALLLHIASVKQVSKVLVYDPVLCPQEKAALRELHCVCIPENELCRRQVQTKTVFYMPHCGRAMYNNLIWANWSPEKLSQLALIGNSFQSYLDSPPPPSDPSDPEIITK